MPTQIDVKVEPYLALGLTQDYWCITIVSRGSGNVVTRAVPKDVFLDNVEGIIDEMVSTLFKEPPTCQP